MTKISLLGRYSTGKRTIASAFTGTDRDKLASKQSRWISQVVGSKDGITLQGLPEEHGRMSAYRERLRAIQASEAFIVVVRNSEPVHFEYYHELVTKTLADKEMGMGPWLVIAGYIEGKPEVNPTIAEFAKKINAKVELLNVAKLSKKEATETQKLDSLIRSFSASIATAPKEVPKKEEATPEADELYDWDDEVPALPTPVLQPTVVHKPTPISKTVPRPVIPKRADAKPVPNTVEPKAGKVARAINFLVRGGSVA